MPATAIVAFPEYEGSIRGETASGRASPDLLDWPSRVPRPAFRVLFLDMTDGVGSDRIVAAMGRLGCVCAVIGTSTTFASRSRFTDELFKLPRLGGRWLRGVVFRRRFAAIVRAWHPDLVVPLDEWASSLLRDPRIGRDPDVVRLLERSLGDPAFFATMGRHAGRLATAGAVGVRTVRVATAATVADARHAAAVFGYPLVLRRERRHGIDLEEIVSDDAGLVAVFARIRRSDKLIVQAYCPGRPASRLVACVDGEILDGISVLSETVDPATGMGTVVRAIDRDDMDVASRAVVAALRCSGFLSLDFIVAADGASLVALNLLPSAAGHLGRLYGHDIHEALLDRLAGRPVQRDAGLRAGPERVALFPQELDREPASLAVGRPFSTLHDLPWDDLDVLGAYAHWLERRHPRLREVLRRRLPLDAPMTPLDLRALVASIDRYPH